MGIVNVTPDSFSDGGEFFDPERALKHALQLIEDGAHILDIGGESTRPGGESTRPGAAPVSVDEEIQRTAPLIQAIRQHSDLPISIDTTKARVAHAAMEAGADIVNDISGMTFDPDMPSLVANTGAAVILMHVPGKGHAMHQDYAYADIANEVWSYLSTQIDVAQQAGIPPESIAIDPGFGFGKNVDQNLALLHELPLFVQRPYPVLVGISRKRTIRAQVGAHREALDHGSSIVHAFAAARGAQLIRTHNVRAARAAIAMQKALQHTAS